MTHLIVWAFRLAGLFSLVVGVVLFVVGFSEGFAYMAAGILCALVAGMMLGIGVEE